LEIDLKNAGSQIWQEGKKHGHHHQCAQLSEVHLHKSAADKANKHKTTFFVTFQQMDITP
jgi:hypothetical protein